MTYARFDDRFWMHPKTLSVGPCAAWMWAASIGYCNANLTDGFVPQATLPMLSMTSMSGALKLAAKLVEARMWEPAEGGFRVHDFVDWNPTSEEIRARKEEISKLRSAAGKAGGKQSGKVRSGAKPAETDRSNEANGKQTGSKPPEAKTKPSPNSSPSPPTEEKEIPYIPLPGEDLEHSEPKPAKVPGRRKRQRPNTVPEADTPPLPGTLARRAYDAIVGDKHLVVITGAPGDFSQRIVDPDAFPGVDVIATIKQAALYLATCPADYTDGRRFLTNQLRRNADKIARQPKPAAPPPPTVRQIHPALLPKRAPQ